MAKNISSEKRTHVFQGPALADKSISKFRKAHKPYSISLQNMKEIKTEYIGRKELL